MRRAKRLLLGLSVAYLVLTALLFFNQRNVLFQPFPGPETPEAAGLSEYQLSHFTSHDGLQLPYWHHNLCLNHPPLNAEESRGAPTGATLERSGMREGDNDPEGRWTRSEAESPKSEHRQNDANQSRSEKGRPSAHSTRNENNPAPLCERSEPILLYFHGNGGGLHAFTHPLGRFAEQGYGVAAMEYRGYPGAPGQPTEQSIIADAKAFAAELAAAHPDRPLVIWGYSLGSGVATQVAAALKQDSVLILEAPFTAAVDLAKGYYPYLPVHRLMKDPFDSKSHIPNINAALFLMHGKTDRIVPYAHSERLYDIAKAPKKRVLYPKGDHFNLDEHGAYQAAFAFIKRHTYTGRKE